MNIVSIECKDFDGNPISEIRVIDNSKMFYIVVGYADEGKQYGIYDDSLIDYFSGRSESPNIIQFFDTRKMAYASEYADVFNMANKVFSMVFDN